ALPRLCPVSDREVAIVYRALRRFPLIQYHWDAVIQTSQPDGWSGPTLVSQSDGPLEEVSAARSDRRLIVAWQSDQSRHEAVNWSHGFGGGVSTDRNRRAHFGEAVWHASHGTGEIRLGATETNVNPAKVVPSSPRL